MKQKSPWFSVFGLWCLVTIVTLPCAADPTKTGNKANPSTKVEKPSSDSKSKGGSGTPQSPNSNSTKDKVEKKARVVDGAAVFKQYCATCHLEGGNSIKPSRPVAESKKVANIGIFKDYLSAPPGHMPYYENLVKDKKTLEALHRYCKSLKRKPIKQAFDGSSGCNKI